VGPARDVDREDDIRARADLQSVDAPFVGGSERTFEEAWAEGWTLPLERAIDLGLSVTDETS
jgi:hypothetical protein